MHNETLSVSFFSYRFVPYRRSVHQLRQNNRRKIFMKRIVVASPFDSIMLESALMLLITISLIFETRIFSWNFDWTIISGFIAVIAIETISFSLSFTLPCNWSFSSSLYKWDNTWLDQIWIYVWFSNVHKLDYVILQAFNRCFLQIFL